MLYVFRLFGQPEDHVVVLASVIFRAEQPALLQKFFIKYGKMTDIIVGAQVVRLIVRLKRHHDQIVQVWRG